MTALFRLVPALLLVAAAPLSAAPVFETVASFETPPLSPIGGLALHSAVGEYKKPDGGRRHAGQQRVRNEISDFANQWRHDDGC